MIHLIPQVKQLTVGTGVLQHHAICCDGVVCDERVLAALMKLPQDAAGTPVTVTVSGDSGEGYELWVGERDIRIEAASAAGAFYAVQTLRQLFVSAEIPCLHIQDEPDFSHRGFYHDITRGRVATLDYLKSMVDKLAYYKINSFQIYAEHTCECEEYADLHDTLGYISNADLRELDAYCAQNFIEFIPSFATFGHLYELLHQEKYRHLRVRRDLEDGPHFWEERQQHHTIDPLHPDSIKTIGHMIDQYGANFTSEYFNICCDETEDLAIYGEQGMDVGKLYLDFVKKIIAHVKGNGKKVMMWADILLQHPEVIDELPQDICFLNWEYSPVPDEEKIARFARLGRPQILCPSTRSWKRLCEDLSISVSNISTMAEYAKRHGALGLLNTSWGDFGHSCSPELMMYGMVLGAAKAWSADMPVDETFDAAVNALLYGSERGVQSLRELNELHTYVNWQCILDDYMELRYHITGVRYESPNIDVPAFQQMYTAYAEKLGAQTWEHDEFRQDMLIAAEGMCVMAELAKRLHKLPVERITDTAAWLEKYRARWMANNRESELPRIEEAFMYIEQNA